MPLSETLLQKDLLHVLLTNLFQHVLLNCNFQDKLIPSGLQQKMHYMDFDPNINHLTFIIRNLSLLHGWWPDF
jgi:hypothetical protein